MRSNLLPCVLAALCALCMAVTPATAQLVLPKLAGVYSFQKTYGGTGDDFTTDAFTISYYMRCHPLDRAADNGYVMVGTTTSFGLSKQNIYVVKTRSDGAFQWSKTYGVPGVDVDGTDIKRTRDGGYVVLGNYNFRSGKSDQQPTSSADIYVVKIDGTGNRQWSFRYGTTNADIGYSIQQTSDQGYIIAGSSFSAARLNDVYLVKLDRNGAMQWSRTYGGLDHEKGYYVRQTSDGGYIVTGYTRSFSAAGGQVYLIKTDNSGAVQWSKTYNHATGTSVQQTSDGGYIVAGYVEGAQTALLLIKTAANGTLQWAKSYQSTIPNEGVSGWDVQQTLGGEYVVAAYINGFPTREMAGLLKVDNAGGVIFSRAYGGRSGGNVSAAMAIQISDGYALGGHSSSVKGSSTDLDLYLVKTDANGNAPCYQEPLTVTSTSWEDENSVSSVVTPVGSRWISLPATATPATATHALCLRETQIGNIVNLGLNDGRYGIIGASVPDIGGEPNMDAAHIWKSEAIWLRTSQDNVVGSRAVGSIYEHEGEHQNPVFNGSPNYLYVMVDNLSGEASPAATLKVYWSKSATNTGWPAHWVNDVNPLDGHLYGDLAGTVTIPALDPGENYVAELPWTPPNSALYGETQSTYSFLARIESDDDPMSFAETANTEQNTRNNNNIAWRNEVNVSAAEMLPGDPGHVKHAIVRNMTGAPLTVGLSLSVPLEEQGINPIISQGSVQVALNGLYALWHAGGSIGTGVVDNGDGTVTVTSEDASIGGMTLAPGEEDVVDVTFSYAGPGVGEDDAFTYDVVQQGGDDGGVGFVLHFPVAPDAGDGGGGGDGGGVTKPAAPGGSSALADAGYRLSAQPNPSSGAVTIAYHLPESGDVRIGIYDLRGVLVRLLVMSEGLSCGDHTVMWDGTDHNGRAVASGTYLYRLETGSGVLSRRLQLVR
ncbi:MAG: hypothetical protein JST22_17225 [Bacteroidetes bacterium]|nr:hypothetical protein [Bacteroidota bacterium]